MGQLLLHIHVVQKKKPKLLQNISCNNTRGQWRMHFSYTSKTFQFPQLHLQEHFLLHQAEGKHKHAFWHSIQENTFYTHLLLNRHWTTTATKTRHPLAWHTFWLIVLEEYTPLREYHHHPTVTQHQHHQLLIKESSGGGNTLFQTDQKKKKKIQSMHTTEDKSLKKQNTFTEPYSSMVVYFVLCSSHSTPWTKCAHIPHKTQHLCRPTDYSSDFCKKWHTTTTTRKMSPTQTDTFDYRILIVQPTSHL